MTRRITQAALIVFSLVLLPADRAGAAEGMVNRKANLDGMYGYEVRSDGTNQPAYVQSNFSKKRAGRFSWLAKGDGLRFVKGTPDGTRVVIARAVSGRRIDKEKKARWEVSLDKTAGSDTPALTLRVYEQGRKTSDFALGSPSREAWFEINWLGARRGSSNDGEVTALRNGKVVATATELDNKAKIGAFAIGMLSNPDAIQQNRSILIDRVWITNL